MWGSKHKHKAGVQVTQCHVEVDGQLSGGGSLLPGCVRGWNSHKACPTRALPEEPSHWPYETLANTCIASVLAY